MKNKKIEKINKELDKCRNSLSDILIISPSSSRRWKLERKLDKLINEKFKLEENESENLL